MAGSEENMRRLVVRVERHIAQTWVIHNIIPVRLGEVCKRPGLSSMQKVGSGAGQFLDVKVPLRGIASSPRMPPSRQ